MERKICNKGLRILNIFVKAELQRIEVTLEGQRR